MQISQEQSDIIQQIELGIDTARTIAESLKVKQTVISARLGQLKKKEMLAIHKTATNRGCYYVYIGKGYEVKQKPTRFKEPPFVRIMNRVKPRGDYPRPARLPMWVAV